MADPGVLGINAGAGLLVAAFVVFVPAGLVPSAAALPLLAFAGSAAVAFLGWRLSVVRRRLQPARRLLLIGVALATGLSSATSLLMLRMSDGDYAFVQNWIAGSIWGASWENVAILAVGLALLTAGALYASRTLNALGLGEAAATGLGVNVPRAGAALTAVAVGASGLACAVGGGLTFVGLVCPHMARRLVGPNFRTLVPGCVLVGAVLMLLADIISRTLLAPNEIPVGIVAAVIGAPYFLYLLAGSPGEGDACEEAERSGFPRFPPREGASGAFEIGGEPLLCETCDRTCERFSDAALRGEAVSVGYGDRVIIKPMDVAVPAGRDHLHHRPERLREIHASKGALAHHAPARRGSVLKRDGHRHHAHGRGRPPDGASAAIAPGAGWAHRGRAGSPWPLPRTRGASDA